MLLKCKDGEKMSLNDSWLNINEEIAYKKVTNCPKTIELKNWDIIT